MKRFISLVLGIVLCLVSVQAFAETELDEFFRCRVGNISFALPGYPLVFQEPDLPAREMDGYLAWQNKYQLTGYGPNDGEFQIHIADLTPCIQWMQEENPGYDMSLYQGNALMNMVQFYLNIYDGRLVGEAQGTLIEVDSIQMNRATVIGDYLADMLNDARADGENKVIPQLTFEYTYPDAPGVDYSGKGYVDGNVAVVMMVQADGANLAYLDDMRPISTKEVNAMPAAVPETVTADRIQITFPEAPLTYLEEGYWLYQAFTEDYAYLCLEHMAFDFSFMLEAGMTMDELLKSMAETAAQGYQAEGTIGDYEIKKLADELYAFEAVETDAGYAQGYGPKETYVLGIFGREGVYTLEAVNTEMGRAAFDSLTIENMDAVGEETVSGLEETAGE